MCWTGQMSLNIFSPWRAVQRQFRDRERRAIESHCWHQDRRSRPLLHCCSLTNALSSVPLWAVAVVSLSSTFALGQIAFLTVKNRMKQKKKAFLTTKSLTQIEHAQPLIGSEPDKNTIYKQTFCSHVLFIFWITKLVAWIIHFIRYIQPFT